MPIDQFTKHQFESVLPSLPGGQLLWQALGLVSGEHCYIVPVKPGVLLYIRSSISSSGLAADCAEDSIRCWVASDSTGTPLASKSKTYVTRVPGWQIRLMSLLRRLYIIGNRLGTCEKCKTLLHARLCKRGFRAGHYVEFCQKCESWGRTLDEGMDEFIKQKEKEQKQRPSAKTSAAVAKKGN